MDQINKLDQKFQCAVHEFSNDIEWINLKRSLVRTPQIFKQKVNIGVQMPKDEEFEELYQNFVAAIDNIQLLECEVLKYHSQIKAFINNSIGLTEKFSALFNPNLDKITESGSLTTTSNPNLQQGYDHFSLSVKLSTKLNEIKFKTSPTLDLFVDNVRDPLSKVLMLANNIKRSVKERDFAVLDINKYMNGLENLKSKDPTTLSLKQEQNLVRYEKNLEISKLRYEQINNVFKEELPKFAQIVSSLVHPLCVVLYYLQLTVYYDLLSINEISDPLFKTRSTDTKSSSYFDQLVAKFTKVHEKVEELTDNLTIIKSLEELRVTRKEITNIQGDDGESLDCQSSAKMGPRTCTAKYDFKGQQAGDLSFKKGDKIEILDQKTNKEWWKGEINGVVGIFPRNYVSL